jgi:hypothetical protein
MRTVIAGTRNIDDYGILLEALRQCPFTKEITEVVSGGATGVDTLGEQWAASKCLPTKVIRPDWKRLGNKAGPIRNAKMADYASALVAVWDGKSSGTKNMIEVATEKGLRVYVHLLK